MSNFKYKWFAPGDLNAFFALFLDNIVNLVLLAVILIGFGIPADFIFSKMIPGTALGVMFGDLVYTWMAFRLAKKSGRSDVTAMPLGLDTPSTIGIAFAVLGPAYLSFLGNPEYSARAAEMTWYVGMGTMVLMGIVKTVASFFGPYIQRIVPVAGLLGSLAGVGIVWLAAHSLIHVYGISFVGMISLGIIVFALMAYFDLPFKLPGAAVAVILGTAVYYLLGETGIFKDFSIAYERPSTKGIGFLPPLPQAGSLTGFMLSIDYISVAVPFGLLTIIGGINVTAGARLAGDDYSTREILFTEAIATLLAGFCGGVSQSTPYIGHSAYKQMGARAAYTLFTGIAVGLGGMFGLIGFIVKFIPKAAVAPILIFVGFEITTLAFRMAPKRHSMAVIFAIIPAILNYGYIQVKILYAPVSIGLAGLKNAIAKMGAQGVKSTNDIIAKIDKIIPHHFIDDYIILGALGQGYILTAMIWGAAVAFIIDRKIWQAALSMIVASVLSLFGLIHSVFPNGNIYLPWELKVTAYNGLFKRSISIPYEFAIAYLLVAATLILIYFFGPARKGTGPSELHEQE